MSESVRVIRRLCVFCGSSNHARPVFYEAARAVGRLCAVRGITVVFGGGSVGMMGALADAALSAGGKVVGVIPRKLLDLELGHRRLTQLHVVEGMHPRKRMMADLSDAFIALPGGYGTLEELFEVTTWTQLRYHDKPIGLLDVDGYFAHLVAFLQRAAAEGFIRPLHADLIRTSTDPAALLDALEQVVLPDLARWIDDP